MKHARCGTSTRCGLFFSFLAAFGTFAAVGSARGEAGSPGLRLAGLVNPFIGTADDGNTFPGATLPFGMVAFSPEEALEDHPDSIPAPGGYQWKAARIRGFSLTHLSGPGCPAGGDIPIMPLTADVMTSPTASRPSYSVGFSHDHEQALPGFYAVKLDNGVGVELSATLRTGIARFSFPAGRPKRLMFRVSDSENGSSDAGVSIDPVGRTVSGSVESGGFCYTSGIYYTLHFFARIDQPFEAGGTWTDGTVNPHGTMARGGTHGASGSGGWVEFNSTRPGAVTVRIGISYVSEAAARANLDAEEPPGSTVDSIRRAAVQAWNQRLGSIDAAGGSRQERTVFYTALYHTLLSPNVTNDVDGRYPGFDGKTHTLAAGQQAQYANFSLWDVYRSQFQLVTWLEAQTGSDIAQSMLNQAVQNGGVWDRWTHLTGRTGVMNGDPSAPAIADIVAFGGRRFDIPGAYASLLKAATVPESDVHGPNKGPRPNLAMQLKLHYLPTATGDGSAADTLEMASADFALSELAARVGDDGSAKELRERSGWWRNLYNPNATADYGYIQPRNADGTWAVFDPTAWSGFVEGSGAQYLWMIPFDPRGLFDVMGGNAAAQARLDGFLRYADGQWAWHNRVPGYQPSSSPHLHADLRNEPTIQTPWLYDFAGQPWKTQEAVRAAMSELWSAGPPGIAGNDDLGEMSSWYVWAALGLYPMFPGRAELVIASPAFRRIVVRRPGGIVTIRAPKAAMGTPYVTELRVDGVRSSRAWLPPSFAEEGGTLDFKLRKTPDRHWGSAAGDAPPSFGPYDRRAP